MPCPYGFYTLTGVSPGDTLNITTLPGPWVAPHLLNAGELLITRYNGNPDFVGACAVMPDFEAPVTYPDKLIRVRLRADRVVPMFIAACCTVGAGRAHITSHIKTSAGQTGISGTDVRAIPLRLPGLPEQERLAAVAQVALDAHAKQSAGIGRVESLLDALKRALILGTTDPARFA